jgi:hypothetical protein
MRIVLVIAHANGHPDLPALRALLQNIEHEETEDRPVGEIPCLPCIAALDDAGRAVHSGGASLDADTLAGWVAASGDIAKPAFPTLLGSDFIALIGGVLGFARLDQLLAKSKTIEALLVKPEKVDRLIGNTPKAIAFLMTGTNALVQSELDAIDAAWRAKGATV